jgi:photosystem II stability/assembly factor-like uncharacterized protein
MKKILLGVLFPFLASAAPLDWEWLWPKPTAATLLDVAVGLTDEKKEVVLAVGAKGTILSSLDQGETWEPRTSNTKANLFDVAFIDQGKGYFLPFAVGDNGTILRGSYDGKTWTALTSGVTTTLRAVWGYDSTRIFAAGDKGVLLVSEDNGYTWKKLKSGVKQNLTGIATPSMTEVYIIGTEKTLLYSSDGKKFAKKKQPISWSEKDKPEESPKIWSTTSGDLWISGANNSIFFSADKGKTWSNPPVSDKPKSGCVRYVINSDAQLLCSADNISWGKQEVMKDAKLRAAAGLDAKTSYAVGDGGLMLRSTDGGKTWESKSKAERGQLLSLWATSQKEIFATGKEGKLLYSSDGGASWVKQNSTVTTTLRAIWGTSSARMFAVGDGGVILRSTDTGKTWERLDSKVKDNLAAIWGINDDIYVVGDKGTLLVSYNNGDVWTPLFSSQKESFYEIIGFSENNIFVLGSAGTTGLILQTKDGGKNWTSTTFANPNRIDALWGDGQNYFALGQGIVLRSSDGGASWAQQITSLFQGTSALTGDSLIDIWGDSQELFLLSSGGTLFRSTTMGKSWTPEALPFGVAASELVGLGSSLFLAGGAGPFELVLQAKR